MSRSENLGATRRTMVAAALGMGGTLVALSAGAAECPADRAAAEATPEDHRVVHWWRNTGRVPAVILSADVFTAGEDPRMM